MNLICPRLLLVGACLAWSASAENYDLILRHGRVVDGTGNPAFHADVAVKAGRIAAVGKVNGTAKSVVDVHGLVIAPGFIDVHTHAEDIEEMPAAENFVRMGVTTLVLGNCGNSKLNVGEFFRKLEALTISPNVATLLGHGTLRNSVMGGSFMRPPTEAELAKMKSGLEQAMKDGAVGMSTGLIYLPGTFAKTEELIELAKVAGAYDGIYASHMRSEGTSIGKSLEELFRIAREAHIRAEVSHIKLSGKSAWGRTEQVLAVIEQACAEGLDITQDEYLYPASSTGIQSRIPEWAREGTDKDYLARLNDPKQKAKIIAEMKKSLRQSGHDNFDYIVIASYKKDKSLNGLNIMEAAKRKRGADSVEDQIELILEMQKSGGASGVFHSMSEDDLRKFLAHPNTMFASDSGVRKFGDGVPHPRGYGNNARVLGEYVRELKLLRLEDAVRRMTSLPATTFRIKDRGLVHEGCWADLVVFNPAKVGDHATFDDPHHYATGFSHVFVNGMEVVREDQHTGARPGRALRHVAAK